MVLSIFRHASILLTAILLLVLFQNCDSFAAVQPPSNEGFSDDPLEIAPIVAEPRKWTFISVDGAKCADGSPTGIGVNLVDEGDDFLVYMQGGGACTSGDNCWGDGPGGAVNLSGYDSAVFNSDTFKDQYPLFDRNEETTNPFSEMNMIFIPYCTGDVHSGNSVRELEYPVGSGKMVPTHFVRAMNVELAMKKVAASFPQLRRVWLLGTSAGGGGATYNYEKIRNILGVQINLIVDSAPGFYDEGDELKWELWGAGQICETCFTVADIRRYNRMLDPGSKYAFLSFAFDKTTANGRTPQRFSTELNSLVGEIQQDSNSRTFVVDNSSTKFTTTLHVVTTKDEPQLVKDVASFLSGMVDSESWENRVFSLSP